MPHIGHIPVNMHMPRGNEYAYLAYQIHTKYMPRSRPPPRGEAVVDVPLFLTSSWVGRLWPSPSGDLTGVGLKLPPPLPLPLLIPPPPTTGQARGGRVGAARLLHQHAAGPAGAAAWLRLRRGGRHRDAAVQARHVAAELLLST